MTVRGGLLAMGVVVLGASASSAQVVGGRIVDGRTGAPIAAAVIHVLDASAAPVAAGASDAAGRYEVPLSAAGSYRVRVTLLGYETRESEPIDVVASTGPAVVDLALEPVAVPIRGLEVDVAAADRRIRQTIGVSPGRLRIRPIRPRSVREHVQRGYDLSDALRSQQIPNLEVLRSRQGPCYQFRGRGCIPVFLDGARLARASVPLVPLYTVSTVVVVLPNELIAYPAGGVHLFSRGFLD